MALPGCQPCPGGQLCTDQSAQGAAPDALLQDDGRSGLLQGTHCASLAALPFEKPSPGPQPDTLQRAQLLVPPWPFHQPAAQGTQRASAVALPAT